MKRKDFGLAMNAIDSVAELKGVKFAFAVLKNRKKIKIQVEEDKPIFEQILKPSEGFKDYEEKRITLCELHSDKDEEGNAITEEDRYKIIDVKKFNVELENLTKDYQPSINDRKTQIDEYNSLMEEEIELSFQVVVFDDLPSDLSEAQLRSIEFMIDIAL